MNNFHIYEEVGRGKDSVVYKVSTFQQSFEPLMFCLGSQKEDGRVCRCQVSWEVPKAKSLKWSKFYCFSHFF